MMSGTLSSLPRSKVGERAARRVARRLMPFLFLAYITNYLDRANVAYATLQMSKDLHFSDRVFGLGAGIFFIGYVLLQIPSALIIARWGARRCVSTIMVIWGMMTVLLAFINTPAEFFGARFLIGLAEAGFFPGIILYMTYWISSRDRAMATAHFMAAIPISFVIGSPIAAFFLSVHCFGLRGWRWIFIGEGIPAIIFGVIMVFYLSDRPSEAQWLPQEERDEIISMLEREKQSKKTIRADAWWEALRQPEVILLTLIIIFAYTSQYGLMFWLPTIIKRLSGFTDFKVALISTLPYIAGCPAMLLCGWHSDRTGERRWHVAVPLFISGVGLLFASGFGASPWLTVAGFTCAIIGYYAFLACFWALPAAVLSESAAAAAIGLVNLVGSLGGFFGPSLVGFLRTRTGTFLLPLEVLGVSMLIAGLFATRIRVQPSR